MPLESKVISELIILIINRMRRERQIPICYQITVTNIITIGIKVMSDFFISFQTQNNGRRWNSPLVRNKISKDSKDYPWTITVDSPHIVINFHFVQQGKEVDHIIGSAPLLLMKKQGEQQFLIFGCSEQNKGRKVAEVMFEYNQSSIVNSIGSQAINQKNNQQSMNSSDTNKRVSLEYTLQMENNSQAEQNMQTQKNNNIGLGSIPEQSQNTVFRESVFKNQKNDQINGKNGKNVEDKQNEKKAQAIVSNMQKQKMESANRSRVASIDSLDLNFLKDIQDTTDRWYRLNFGKQKPLSNEPYDFDNHQNSRVQVVHYEKQYEYLNDITFSDPHIELKNIIINSNKKPKAIQVYSMGKDPQDERQLIAGVQSSEGYKKEWSNVLRLPKEQTTYGLDVITSDKERLQGLIIRDSNYLKNTMELFDKLGKNVGNVTFNLKEVKKVEIQTMEIMEELPNCEQAQQDQELSQSKSRIEEKSFLNNTQNNKSQNKVNNNNIKSQFVTAFIQDSDSSNGKPRLLNNVYLNRKLHSEDEFLSKNDDSQNNHAQQIFTKPRQQRQMNNKLYLNRQEKYTKKSNARKNKYESIKPFGIKGQLQHKLRNEPVSKSMNVIQENRELRQDNNIIKLKDQGQYKLKPSDMSEQISNHNNSLNSSNQFLKNIKYQLKKIPSPAKSAVNKKQQIQLQKINQPQHLMIQKYQNQISQVNVLDLPSNQKHNLKIEIQQKNNSMKPQSHLEEPNHFLNKQHSQNHSQQDEKHKSFSKIQEDCLENDLEPSLSLKNKIHQIQRISHDLSKMAKVISSKPKNMKYKTIVYNQDKNLNQYEDNIRHNSLSNQSSQQQISAPKKTYRQPINAPIFSAGQVSINDPNINKNMINMQKEQDLIKNKALSKQIKLLNYDKHQQNIFNESKNHHVDAEQEIPIRKPSHNGSFIHSSSTKQQKSLIIPAQVVHVEPQIKDQQISNQQPTTRMLSKQKEKSQLGINTERMVIVNNIMQSSYIPVHSNEQRLQKNLKSQKPEIIKQSPEKDDWARSSLKEQLGSFFDSIMPQKQREPKTKFLTEPIQPATQRIKSINFLIATISINYYDTIFGGKCVKIYVPNKFLYLTDIRTKLLAWNCKGFAFNHILQSQNVYIQLCNDSQNNQQILGTAIISSIQFKNKKNQTVIRSFLTHQNRIIGEVVLSYQSLRKNMIQIKELPQKRHTTSHDNKTLEHPQRSQQTYKHASSLKKKRYSNQKNVKDPVVQFLKINRKQKISRYMTNQYSRANIESRINPIRVKKYTAGKNIVIGKDIRFPFSLEEEHFQAVPGPGTYQTRSQFKRYRDEKQTRQK